MHLLQTVQLDRSGRTIVVGDVQGYFDELLAALERINFNWEKDLLIGVGDCVTGGPKSKECAELLGRRNVHSCIGNHEVMLLTEIQRKGKFNPSIAHAWFNRLSIRDQNQIKDLFSVCPLELRLVSPRYRYSLTHAAPTIISSKPSDVLFGLPDAISHLPADDSYNLSIHGHIPISEPLQVENHLWIDTYGRTGQYTFVELSDNGWEILRA